MRRKTSSPIGVITGTGVSEQFDLSKSSNVGTEYGEVKVYHSIDGTFFLVPRHGVEHDIPPHMINHRANIFSLHKLGVTRVIATSAVGSMRRSLRIGDIGLADQFLDFTTGRERTFFDSTVRHTDMTHPYSVRIGDAIKRASKWLRIGVKSGLVYVCSEGPRFETAAEVRMFRRMGGDVIGMTGVPEVVLANELGMEYSAILVVTNWAAGLQNRVTHEEVVREMQRKGPLIRSLIQRTITHLMKE